MLTLDWDDYEELDWSSTEGADILETLALMEEHIKREQEKYPEGSIIWRQYQICLEVNAGVRNGESNE